MRIAVLFLVVVGCGKSGTAVTGDAPPDALDPAADALGDAQLGSATVTVLSIGHQNPTANAPVLFTDPSGTSTEAHTDANGQVIAAIAPGTSVTAITDDGFLTTITGAMPGDHLTFGLGRFHPAPTLTVTFSDFAPGAAYTLYSPCARTSVTPPSTTVDLQFCNGPITDTDVYILGSTSTMSATAAAHHVDLTTGALTIPNTWTPFRTIDVTYTGFQVGEVSVASYDVPESYSGGPGSLDVTHTTLTIPATAPTQLIRTDVDNGIVAYQNQSFIDRVDPSATTYTLSSSELRPWITSVSFDVATRTASSVVPAGLTGDVVVYDLGWSDGGGGYHWTVYAPTFQAVTLPTLPADMPDPVTTTGPNSKLYPSVAVYDSSLYTSYDEIRPRILAATWFGDPSNVPGRAYVQALIPQ